MVGIGRLADFLLRSLGQCAKLAGMLKPNSIVAGDCIKLMEAGDVPQVDLIFADPPFNIGYKYDVYEDRKAYDDYYAWTERWMAACLQCLKPDGTFWIAIGDEYAAEVKTIGDRLGLHLRNWVIWHYTFGQSTKSKFARSHAHLFYWTHDAKNFTFNDMAVRIPSARQTTYADKRANPKGKLPDDVWSFSRVCGTFHERVKWHPCQMPERLLERIVKVSSDPGDLVFDPFSGSGTTVVVAAQLGRKYLGTDLSAAYVCHSKKRLADTLAGKRKRTEISEDPAAKRAARAVKKSAKKSAKKAVKKAAKKAAKKADEKAGRLSGIGSLD